MIQTKSKDLFHLRSIKFNNYWCEHKWELIFIKISVLQRFKSSQWKDVDATGVSSSLVAVKQNETS